MECSEGDNVMAKYVDALEFHADRVPANGKRALVTGITGK